MLHDFSGNRPATAVKLPERQIQKFVPLPRLAGAAAPEDLEFLFAKSGEVTPAKPAAARPPIVRDAENRILKLSRLSFPVDRGAALPTIVACRRAGNIVRQTLLASCGDEGLDDTALMALSRSAGELPDSTTVTVYWPEPPADSGKEE